MDESDFAMDIMEDIVSTESGGASLLTKTLVPSPIIKDIFEANLRSHNSQDVIFTKDHVIELYSLDNSSFVLESSLPIPSRVRCAVPFIRTRKDPVDELDNILLKQSSSQPEPQSRDSILLVTESGYLLVVNWDTGGPRMDGGLVFKPGLRQRNAVHIDYRPGGTPASLGKFIKVSEDSKWLAIGAWQDMFQLDFLSESPQTGNLQALLHDGTKDIFSSERRMFYVEGIILQFEFLKTAHVDGLRFMVYVVDEYGKPKILLYERPPTGMQNINGIRQIATFPMSAEFQCPLHMIPLDNGDVSILFEKELIIVDPRELTVGSHHPFTLRTRGLVGACVKSSRSSISVKSKGSLLLGSSKGNVYAIDLDEATSSKHAPLHPSAVFKTNPVSSILHYSRGDINSNILFVGGEMCDTVLYLVPDDLSEIVHFHTIPNWSPVMDCVLVGSLMGKDDEDLVSRSIDPLALEFPSEERDRLYVGAGHRAVGAAKELRRGLHTNVTVEFDLDHVQRLWHLTYGKENSEGLIVVTMTYNETKVLRWTSLASRTNHRIWSGDLEIDDITPTLSDHLMLSEPTLATSFVAGGILQVTPSGLYFSETVRRQVSAQERIVQASVVGKDMILVVYNDSGIWTLWSVSVEANQSAEGTPDAGVSFLFRGQTELLREPSAIRLLHINDSTELETMVAFVAYRYPRILIMYNLKDARGRITEFRVDPEASNDMPEDPRASEIHSIDTVYGHGQTYILLGMRHGYMISYKLDRVDDIFSFVEPQTTKFGQSQVEFITATHDEVEEIGTTERNSVFVRCEYLWQISLEDGLLRIDEVLFDDIRMPRISSGSLSLRSRELVLLMDDVIRFVDVGSQVGIWPRTIPIGETPRRIHYDTKMQRMIVACSNVETESGKMNNLVVIDILRNELRKAIPSEDKFDEDLLNLIPPRNIINCLYEWRFRSYDKVFSLICLGMGDNTPASETPKNGRIVIVACRMSSSKQNAMRTKVIRKFQTKYPVFAIAKLDDRRLLYSWGNSLSMITFEPRSEEDGHRFRLENKESVFTAPSPIIHITVKGDRVYCSTLKDSVFMLQATQRGDAFQYISGDSQPRFSTFHLATEREILVVDKAGDLVGLNGDVSQARHRSFNQVFKIHLQSPITRIREGILRGPRIGDGDVVKESTCIATGINGSITVLRRCPKWKYQLLSLTEQLLASFAPDYFLGSPVSKYQNIRKGWDSPSNAMSVDRLDYVESRLISEVKVPLSHFPLHLRGHMRAMSQITSEGDNAVDLVHIVRRIMNEEFGGISL